MRLTTKIKYNYITPDNVENIEQKCLNKLGQLEDILEKYQIENIEELEILCKYAESVREWMSIHKEKMDKIRDIEKELGIDLVILFKASKGIAVYNESKTAIEINVIPTIDLLNKILIVYTGDLLKPYKTLYFKDYGKTWALTKEELL